MLPQYPCLWQVECSDGVKLHGLWETPAANSQAEVDPDRVILLIHGTGSNFYGSRLLGALARRFLLAGYATLRANTRGHDLVYTTATALGTQRLGAAYECVDHCRYDLRAWLDHLQRQGAQRVVLLGHSLGAVKAVYFQAAEPHPLVSHLVAVSPARLSYEYFARSEHGPRFQELFRRAAALVEQGRGEELLEVDFPLPYLVSARSYLDKYGPEERYNVLRHLVHVNVPQLYTFGQRELGHVAFAELPEEVLQHAAPGQRVQVNVIPGADHQYTDMADPLAQTIARFLNSFPVN